MLKKMKNFYFIKTRRGQRRESEVALKGEEFNLLSYQINMTYTSFLLHDNEVYSRQLKTLKDPKIIFHLL